MAPLFFLGLGAHALSDPDEPYYAVPALEMLRTGTWQVTIFRGQPWFDKPILFYWIVLAAYKCLGVSEAAARIGSALAGLAGALMMYVFARRMGLGTRGAMLSGLILGTMVGYALAARTAITDMTLTATLTAGLLFAARYLETGGLPAAALAGAAFGLAALTKGPVGVLVPAVSLAAYGALARRRDLVRPAAVACAAAGFLITAAPWYLYMIRVYPHLLVDTFIGQGNVGRFLNPEHTTIHFYYVVVLAVGLLPWSGALPAALIRGAGPAARAAARETGRHPGGLYLLCWFGAVLFIFSLAASKLPSYILPAFPPAALLLASFWETALPPPPGRAGRAAMAAALLGVLIAIFSAAGVLYVTRSHDWSVAAGDAAAAGGVVLAGSVAAALAVWRGSLKWFTVVQCGTAAAAIAVFLVLAMPRLEPYDSTRPLVRELEARGAAADVIATYKVIDVSLDYYLGRSVPRALRMREVRDLAARQPGGLWVVRSDDVAALRAAPDLIADEVLRGPHRSVLRLAPASRPVEGVR